MACTVLTKNVPQDDVVTIIASEIAGGVEQAVECWMAEIDQALTDAHLTSLGRLNAVTDIVGRYKSLTGKIQLQGRKAVVGREF